MSESTLQKAARHLIGHAGQWADWLDGRELDVVTDGVVADFYDGDRHVMTMPLEQYMAIQDAQGEAEEKPSAPPPEWDREL